MSIKETVELKVIVTPEFSRLTNLEQKLSAGINVKVNLDTAAAAAKWETLRTQLSRQIVPKIDQSQLYAFNAHIELKMRHWSQLKALVETPLKPSIDYSAFKNLPKIEIPVTAKIDYDRIKKDLEAVVNVKFNVQVKSDSEQALYTAFTRALNNQKQNPLEKVLSALAVPFKVASDQFTREASKSFYRGTGADAGVQQYGQAAGSSAASVVDITMKKFDSTIKYLLQDFVMMGSAAKTSADVHENIVNALRSIPEKYSSAFDSTVQFMQDGAESLIYDGFGKTAEKMVEAVSAPVREWENLSKKIQRFGDTLKLVDNEINEQFKQVGKGNLAAPDMTGVAKEIYDALTLKIQQEKGVTREDAAKSASEQIATKPQAVFAKYTRDTVAANNFPELNQQLDVTLGVFRRATEWLRSINARHVDQEAEALAENFSQFVPDLKEGMKKLVIFASPASNLGRAGEEFGTMAQAMTKGAQVAAPPMSAYQFEQHSEGGNAIQQLSREIGKLAGARPVAGDNAKAVGGGETISDTLSGGLFGYSTSTVELLATIKAALGKGYKPEDITVLGHSLGTFVTRTLIDVLDELGNNKIKGVGTAIGDYAPSLMRESPNYRSIYNQQDALNMPLALGMLSQSATQYSTRATPAGKGTDAHAFAQNAPTAEWGQLIKELGLDEVFVTFEGKTKAELTAVATTLGRISQNLVIAYRSIFALENINDGKPPTTGRHSMPVHVGQENGEPKYSDVTSFSVFADALQAMQKNVFSKIDSPEATKKFAESTGGIADSPQFIGSIQEMSKRAHAAIAAMLTSLGMEVPATLGEAVKKVQFLKQAMEAFQAWSTKDRVAGSPENAKMEAFAPIHAKIQEIDAKFGQLKNFKDEGTLPNFVAPVPDAYEFVTPRATAAGESLSNLTKSTNTISTAFNNLAKRLDSVLGAQVTKKLSGSPLNEGGAQVDKLSDITLSQRLAVAKEDIASVIFGIQQAGQEWEQEVLEPFRPFVRFALQSWAQLYGLAKGVEDATLSGIPFGKAGKAVAQTVGIPLGIAGALSATHPEVYAALHGAVKALASGSVHAGALLADLAAKISEVAPALKPFVQTLTNAERVGQFLSKVPGVGGVITGAGATAGAVATGKLSQEATKKLLGMLLPEMIKDEAASAFTPETTRRAISASQSSAVQKRVIPTEDYDQMKQMWTKTNQQTKANIKLAEQYAAQGLYDLALSLVKAAQETHKKLGIEAFEQNFIVPKRGQSVGTFKTNAEVQAARLSGLEQQYSEAGGKTLPMLEAGSSAKAASDSLEHLREEAERLADELSAHTYKGELFAFDKMGASAAGRAQDGVKPIVPGSTLHELIAPIKALVAKETGVPSWYLNAVQSAQKQYNSPYAAGSFTEQSLSVNIAEPKAIAAKYGIMVDDFITLLGHELFHSTQAFAEQMGTSLPEQVPSPADAASILRAAKASTDMAGISNPQEYAKRLEYEKQAYTFEKAFYEKYAAELKQLFGKHGSPEEKFAIKESSASLAQLKLDSQVKAISGQKLDTQDIVAAYSQVINAMGAVKAPSREFVEDLRGMLRAISAMHPEAQKGAQIFEGISQRLPNTGEMFSIEHPHAPSARATGEKAGARTIESVGALAAKNLSLGMRQSSTLDDTIWVLLTQAGKRAESFNLAGTGAALARQIAEGMQASFGDVSVLEGLQAQINAEISNAKELGQIFANSFDTASLGMVDAELKKIVNDYLALDAAIKNSGGKSNEIITPARAEIVGNKARITGTAKESSEGHINNARLAGEGVAAAMENAGKRAGVFMENIKALEEPFHQVMNIAQAFAGPVMGQMLYGVQALMQNLGVFKLVGQAAFVAVGIGVAAYSVAQLGVAQEMLALRLQFESLGKSGTNNLEKIGKVAQRTGSDFRQTAKLAAAIQGGLISTPLEGNALDITEKITKINQALQLTPEVAQRFETAMTQMFAKGVVSMEELRQQAAEAVPAIIPSFASSQGLSVGQLTAKVSAGEVSSYEAVPKALDALVKMSRGAYEEGLKSLPASMNRLSNSMLSVNAAFGKIPLDMIAGLAYHVADLAEGLTPAVKALAPFAGIMTAIGVIQLGGFIARLGIVTGGIKLLTNGLKAFYLTSAAGLAAPLNNVLPSRLAMQGPIRPGGWDVRSAPVGLIAAVAALTAGFVELGINATKSSEAGAEGLKKIFEGAKKAKTALDEVDIEADTTFGKIVDSVFINPLNSVIGAALGAKDAIESFAAVKIPPALLGLLGLGLNTVTGGKSGAAQFLLGDKGALTTYAESDQEKRNKEYLKSGSAVVEGIKKQRDANLNSLSDYVQKYNGIDAQIGKNNGELLTLSSKSDYASTKRKKDLLAENRALESQKGNTLKGLFGGAESLEEAKAEIEKLKTLKKGLSGEARAKISVDIINLQQQIDLVEKAFKQEPFKINLSVAVGKNLDATQSLEKSINSKLSEISTQRASFGITSERQALDEARVEKENADSKLKILSDFSTQRLAILEQDSSAPALKSILGVSSLSDVSNEKLSKTIAQSEIDPAFTKYKPQLELLQQLKQAEVEKSAATLESSRASQKAAEANLAYLNSLKNVLNVIERINAANAAAAFSFENFKIAAQTAISRVVVSGKGSLAEGDKASQLLAPEILQKEIEKNTAEMVRNTEAYTVLSGDQQKFVEALTGTNLQNLDFEGVTKALNAFDEAARKQKPITAGGITGDSDVRDALGQRKKNIELEQATRGLQLQKLDAIKQNVVEVTQAQIRQMRESLIAFNESVRDYFTRLSDNLEDLQYDIVSLNISAGALEAKNKMRAAMLGMTESLDRQVFQVILDTVNGINDILIDGALRQNMRAARDLFRTNATQERQFVNAQEDRKESINSMLKIPEPSTRINVDQYGQDNRQQKIDKFNQLIQNTGEKFNSALAAPLSGIVDAMTRAGNTLAQGGDILKTLTPPVFKGQGTLPPPPPLAGNNAPLPVPRSPSENSYNQRMEQAAGSLDAFQRAVVKGTGGMGVMYNKQGQNILNGQNPLVNAVGASDAHNYADLGKGDLLGNTSRGTNAIAEYLKTVLAPGSIINLGTNRPELNINDSNRGSSFRNGGESFSSQAQAQGGIPLAAPDFVKAVRAAAPTVYGGRGNESTSSPASGPSTSGPSTSRLSSSPQRSDESGTFVQTAIFWNQTQQDVLRKEYELIQRRAALGQSSVQELARAASIYSAFAGGNQGRDKNASAIGNFNQTTGQNFSLPTYNNGKASQYAITADSYTAIGTKGEKYDDSTLAQMAQDGLGKFLGHFGLTLDSGLSQIGYDTSGKAKEVLAAYAAKGEAITRNNVAKVIDRLYDGLEGLKGISDKALQVNQSLRNAGRSIEQSIISLGQMFSTLSPAQESAARQRQIDDASFSLTDSIANQKQTLQNSQNFSEKGQFEEALKRLDSLDTSKLPDSEVQNIKKIAGIFKAAILDWEDPKGMTGARRDAISKTIAAELALTEAREQGAIAARSAAQANAADLARREQNNKNASVASTLGGAIQSAAQSAPISDLDKSRIDAMVAYSTATVQAKVDLDNFTEQLRASGDLGKESGDKLLAAFSQLQNIKLTSLQDQLKVIQKQMKDTFSSSISTGLNSVLDGIMNGTLNLGQIGLEMAKSVLKGMAAPGIDLISNALSNLFTTGKFKRKGQDTGDFKGAIKTLGGFGAEQGMSTPLMNVAASVVNIDGNGLGDLLGSNGLTADSLGLGGSSGAEGGGFFSSLLGGGSQGATGTSTDYGLGTQLAPITGGFDALSAAMGGLQGLFPGLLDGFGGLLSTLPQLLSSLLSSSGGAGGALGGLFSLFGSGFGASFANGGTVIPNFADGGQASSSGGFGWLLRILFPMFGGMLQGESFGDNPFLSFLSPLMSKLFGFGAFADGGTIPNYAAGSNPIAAAMSRESAQSGRKPFVAVLHEGEEVLTTKNGEADTMRRLKASGAWNLINQKRGNFAEGGTVTGAGAYLMGAKASLSSRLDSAHQKNSSSTTFVLPPNTDAPSLRRSVPQLASASAQAQARASRSRTNS